MRGIVAYITAVTGGLPDEKLGVHSQVDLIRVLRRESARPADV